MNDGSQLQLDRDSIDNDGYVIPNTYYYDTGNGFYSIHEGDHNVRYLHIRDKSGSLVGEVRMKASHQYSSFNIVGVLGDGRVMIHESGIESEIYLIEIIDY